MTLRRIGGSVCNSFVGEINTCVTFALCTRLGRMGSRAKGFC